MVFELTRTVYRELVEAARGAAPLEACGLLAGRGLRATRFYPLTNLDAAADHFRMVPEEQFAAVRDMLGAGMKLMAIWHSHPVTPPRMSAEDLRLAFTPGVVYLILSLAGAAPELGAWTVREGAAERVDAVVTGIEDEP